MTTVDREVCYTTREAVQQALDSKQTARNATRIDECIASSSRDVEGLTHRLFYPWTGTRYKDWPSSRSTSWRVWLDEDEVVSASAVTSGGTALTGYFLEPANHPPYDRIEIDRGSTGAFSSGNTSQRSLAITGVFMGCVLRETSAGTLASSIGSSDAALTVSDGSLVGVGSLIRIDSERLQVFEKTAVDTTQTINADLLSSAGAVTVAVDDGTTVHVGEVLLIDSERMFVVDVAGNNVTVKRAWDGSVLATHSTGAALYALRRCSVTRGVLGTTAAAHSGAAAILAHAAPSLVRELTTAYTMTALLQGSSSYSLVVGSADSQREASGRAIRLLEQNVMRAYGRQARTRTV